jgi:hypothetical protein
MQQSAKRRRRGFVVTANRGNHIPIEKQDNYFLLITCGNTDVTFGNTLTPKALPNDPKSGFFDAESTFLSTCFSLTLIGCGPTIAAPW